MINRYVSSIITKWDSNTVEVFRKSFQSIIVKVIGIGISLIVSVFIGRVLGAEGLGVINLSNRIVQLTVAFGLFGIQQVIIKEVSIAHKNGDFKTIGNVMFSSYIFNGLLSLSITLVMALLSPYIAADIFNEPKLRWPLLIAVLVITPQVFSRIYASGLIGYRKIWQSSLVDQTLSMTFTGLLLFILFFTDFKITINIVAIAYAIGRLVVTGVMAVYWIRLYRYKIKRSLYLKRMLKTAKPLFYTSIIVIVVTTSDTLLLGFFSNSTQLGLYVVASKIALLTSFVLQVTNNALSPKIAQLYKSGEKEKLEQMVQTTTKSLFYIGLASFFILVVFGVRILSIWGDDFTLAYWSLIILSFGQLINISTGASGVLLVMTGFEKIRRNIAYFSLVVNLTLNVIMIYYYGAIGAAIAMAITVITENLLKVYFAKKTIGILTIKLF